MNAICLMVTKTIVFTYVCFSMAVGNENHFIKVTTKCKQSSVNCYYVTHGKELVKMYQK